MSESILEEAERLVSGDRQDDYGHPYHDLSRTAKIWSGILGINVTPEQVAMCMIGVKISRECNQSKRDNRVDGAGYFKCLDMIYEKRREAIDALTRETMDGTIDNIYDELKKGEEQINDNAERLFNDNNDNVERLRKIIRESR